MISLKQFCFILGILFVQLVDGQELPFQGKLLNSGVPFTGAANFQFSIPSVGWSETKNGVSVQDGYYAVVLGETNPLPDSLFKDSNTASLSITVNGESLSAATLYSPFLDLDVTNVDMTFRGVNGTRNTVITNRNDNEGQLIMYNSFDRASVYLDGRDNGGRLQLSNLDAGGSFNRAALLMGTNATGDGTFIQMSGLNQTSTGTSTTMSAYNTGNDIFGTPFSNGFRRGGIDLFANDGGSFMAALGVNRDEAGSDPTGKTGLLTINGTSTRNAMLAGKWWENHNLGILQIFGQNDNGAGDFSTNAILEALDESGESSGQLLLFNTANGGTQVSTVQLQSNTGGSGLGYLQISNATGNNTVSLRGDGNISVNRVSDGGSAANFFLAGDNGGISIQSASDINRFFFEAGAGDLNMRSSVGANTVTVSSENGNINVVGQVSADILQSTTGTVQASDRRLKKDIQTIENGLEKTIQLRGVTYKWIDPSRTDARQIGVIAQEVEEVFPELVLTDESGMKAVNYAQLTAVLIEAIKELDRKVEQLSAENNQLKSQLSEVATLRKEIEAIRELVGIRQSSSN